ncbi:MAG: hypothetical protein U0457_20525 [Candidatus Sericytochromatia bacterium]
MKNSKNKIISLVILSLSFSCSNFNQITLKNNEEVSILEKNTFTVDINNINKTNKKGANFSIKVNNLNDFSLKSVTPVSAGVVSSIRKYKVSLCTDINNPFETSLTQQPIILDRNGQSLTPPHTINFMNVPAGTYYAVINIMDENDKSLLEPIMVNNTPQHLVFSSNSVTVNSDLSLTFSNASTFLQVNPQLAHSKPGSEDFPLNVNNVIQTNQNLAYSLNNKGDGLVVWNEKRSTDNDIYAIRIKAFNPIGNPFQVNLNNTGEQLEPSVSVNDLGTGYVAWTTPENTKRRVYIRKIDFYAPVGDEFPASQTFSGDQKNPEIKMNNLGNGFITWVDNSADNINYVLAKRDISNQLLSSNAESFIDVALGSSRNPKIYLNDSGNGIITWESTGINYRTINAGIINSTAGIAVASILSDSNSKIALNSLGKGLIVWKDGVNIKGLSINNFTPISETSKFNVSDIDISTTKDNPNVSIDDNSNGFIVWEDARENNTKNNIYAKKILNLNPDGNSDIRVTSSDVDLALEKTPFIKLNNGGNGVVAWLDFRNNNNSVSFRHFINNNPFTDNNVATFAGVGGAGAFLDGTFLTAKFNTPRTIAFDSLGNLYINDFGNSKLRKIDLAGNVSTLTTIFVPTLNNPSGIIFDSANNMYIADTGNNTIKKISSDFTSVTTFAGNGTAGDTIGTATSSSFNKPTSMAFDNAGNMYVVDSFNNKIKKIDSSGNVTNFAGTGTAGLLDGALNTSMFNQPTNIVYNNTLNALIVSEASAMTIRKIDLASSTVSTLVGNGTIGNKNSKLTFSRINTPKGLDVDTKGNTYFADALNNQIKKIDKYGNVSTIAGKVVSGDVDGSPYNALFNIPYDLKIKDGYIYFSDSGNNKIKRLKLF